ncbi:MAG: hypothetical protein Q4P84_06220 [Elusimicrobiales bacterium]|nr:hypothetical protein [Elusimicrobiales bacterium]
MEKNLEVLSKIGVLPSVELTFPADILALADALSAAGVPCAEFVYGVGTVQVLELLAEKRPDFIAGAFVHTKEEAEAAQKAGAKFITDKGDSCKNIPGGRVALETALLSACDWAAVTRCVNGALLKFLDFNLRHVGINSKDEAESSATASLFERIFGFPKEDRGGAYFAGDIIEVMKKPFYGRHGHIAISTADAACAARYLESCGVKLNWDSAGYNPDGRLRVVYLQDEIGGFAVHILQK